MPFKNARSDNENKLRGSSHLHFCEGLPVLPTPDSSDSDGLTPEEKEKLEADEAFLKNKLLISLVTNVLHLAAVNGSFAFSYDLFSILQSTSHQPRMSIYIAIQQRSESSAPQHSILRGINPSFTLLCK